MAFTNTESPGFTSASGTPFSCAGTEIEETTNILVSIFFIYSGSVYSPSLWFVNGIRLGKVQRASHTIFEMGTRMLSATELELTHGTEQNGKTEFSCNTIRDIPSVGRLLLNWV